MCAGKYCEGQEPTEMKANIREVTTIWYGKLQYLSILWKFPFPSASLTKSTVNSVNLYLLAPGKIVTTWTYDYVGHIVYR